MSYDPYSADYDASSEVPSVDRTAVRGRVQPAAIALIVVAVLNLLYALYLVVNTCFLTVMPAKRLQEQQKGMYDAFPPEMKAEMAKKSPEEMKTQILVIYWPLTLFVLAGTALSLAGGIRMLSLRNYALGVMGAICAAIPCVSGAACCGIGEGIGIWALVVLLNENVRSAFR